MSKRKSLSSLCSQSLGLNLAEIHNERNYVVQFFEIHKKMYHYFFFHLSIKCNKFVEGLERKMSKIAKTNKFKKVKAKIYEFIEEL